MLFALVGTFVLCIVNPAACWVHASGLHRPMEGQAGAWSQALLEDWVVRNGCDNHSNGMLVGCACKLQVIITASCCHDVSLPEVPPVKASAGMCSP